MSSNTTTTTTTTTTTNTLAASIQSLNSQIEQKYKSNNLIDQLLKIKKHFSLDLYERYFTFDDVSISSKVFNEMFDHFSKSLEENDPTLLAKGVKFLLEMLYFKVYLFVKEGKLHLFLQNNFTDRGAHSAALIGTHFTSDEINRNKVLRICHEDVNTSLNRSIEIAEKIFRQIPKTQYFLKPDVLFFSRKQESDPICYHAVIEDYCGLRFDIGIRSRQTKVVLIQQLGSALLELHSCKLFHRDLSLGNMLSLKEKLKIIDLSDATTEEYSTEFVGTSEVVHAKYDEAEQKQEKICNRSKEIFSVAATIVVFMNDANFFTRDKKGFITDGPSKVEKIVKDTMKEYQEYNLDPKFISFLIKGLDINKNSEIDIKAFYESIRDCVKPLSKQEHKETERKL